MVSKHTVRKLPFSPVASGPWTHSGDHLRRVALAVGTVCLDWAGLGPAQWWRETGSWKWELMWNVRNWVVW